MATSSDDGEQPLAETLATASRRLGDVTKMMNEYTNHSTVMASVDVDFKNRDTIVLAVRGAIEGMGGNLPEDR